MFSSNMFFFCMVLIGVSMICAEEPQHEPHHDDRKFRFPFSSVGIVLNRNGESVPHDSPRHQDPADRALFSLIPSLVPCNHTQQGMLSCSSCSQVLICFNNDIGVRRSCGPLFCNGGICSILPMSTCNATSS